MGNPISEVQKFGQSIWYDNIRRGLITSGELAAMVENDGLLGVTSNPAIFEKALTGSTDYDPAIKALVTGGGGASAIAIYEAMAGEDIKLGADVLYPVYAKTSGRDGYISFEVSPYLANDTKGTVEEARRLHKALGRDNVLIKIPATPAGVPAIRQVLADGINVNVTLLFSVDAYASVADAYMAGLEDLAAKGGDVSKVASVASFFISRIDSLIDDEIGKALDVTEDPNRRAKLKSIVGKVAIANAKIAYAKFLELYATDRWKALAAKGAKPQRLLWASTGTKNPKYPKTLYVDELIGQDTVNTVPAETYAEFKAHGKVRPSLTENWAENLEQAREVMDTLADVGLSMKDATDRLLADAVQKFCDPFDKLLGAVEKKRQALLGKGLSRLSYALGDAEAAVKATLEDWRAGGKVRRLWAGDATLWSGTDEGQWLGWLHVVDGQRDHPETLRQIARDVKEAGFTHALLLGMGGSSLCPEVLKKTFGAISGAPELFVLDSTVPAQVRAVEAKVDLAKTVCIVSSKSGGTTEPNVFRQYFQDRVQMVIGTEPAGSHFIAVTDPNTKMHRVAKENRFRHIAFGDPTIGGRFSALSNFGMVPAAVMGLDFEKFLDNAEVMVQSCASCVPPESNPGVILGAVLGTLAKQKGRDKVTIVASPGIADLGAWLEQLIAESTGKSGTGLVPVDNEKLGPPAVYGNDRVFAYVRLNSAPCPDQDAAIDALEKAGQPVVRIGLDDTMELGQEFFRWEIATAVAGSILGINAFNQPDVEASKIKTRELSAAYAETGKVPSEPELTSGGGMALYTDPKNAEALKAAASSNSPEAILAAHLGRIKPGDYFALNAYVEMNDEHDAPLQAIRLAVRDRKLVATTLGYGPRFLHSTGQLHKGGPNSGVFLQITSDDAEDLPIPGEKYTFGLLKQFQAQGDFAVLAERDRRALRVHLGPDVRAGLERLRAIVTKILG
ncbi:MAG TPA: bifunctional transaldolase/phosoglucose isomerase [Isosphaeraceae bacterium]|jgi:transaldolase/glucose-6-phosphate isomerase|nr:bifunctional transaldolase/phosoglucose isomerase [Isosphaeraceae bacterium]